MQADSAMEINLDELRKVTDRLYDHLAENGISTVSLGHDYYWSVSMESRYNPYVQPTELTLGQLTDDVHELRRILSGDQEPLAYALVWLAAVLRAIGEEVIA
jgi:hypothetical protein